MSVEYRLPLGVGIEIGCKISIFVGHGQINYHFFAYFRDNLSFFAEFLLFQPLHGLIIIKDE